jgi:hypothetical protein
MKNKILVKPNEVEMSFEDLCQKEYLKINGLMGMMEEDLNISLHDYPELRNKILDISNFIKRLPNYINEIY